MWVDSLDCGGACQVVTGCGQSCLLLAWFALTCNLDSRAQHVAGIIEPLCLICRSRGADSRPDVAGEFDEEEGEYDG